MNAVNWDDDLLEFDVMILLLEVACCLLVVDGEEINAAQGTFPICVN